MMDMRVNIETGKYDSKMSFKENREAWQLERAELMEVFKEDLFESCEVSSSPKVEKAYRLAWDYGHACGFTDVVYHFENFVELLFGA
jgi:hypothetical protein